MSDPQARVVIVGAGHAGGTAAALLRQYGFEGAITLLGEEPVAPYQRPPLSKAWLKGEADADSLALKPERFYAEQNIDLRMGVRALAIDRAAKTVGLGDGATVPYDTLILATGARARRLDIPGADLAGVLSLRSAADAEQLKAALGPGKRLAVIGGGYIGLEAAASARALGAEVVVIEREPRILARVACEPLSAFFQAYHRARGVRFELGVGVAGFEGEAGHVTGVPSPTGGSSPATWPWSVSARFRTRSWRRPRAFPAPTAWWSTWRRAPPIRPFSPSAMSPTGPCRSTTAPIGWKASPTPWSRPSRRPQPSPDGPRPPARRRGSGPTNMM